MSMTDDVPVIVLEGLDGNVPTHLKGIQIYIEPHTSSLIILWWIIFIATVFVVFVRTFINR